MLPYLIFAGIAGFGALFFPQRRPNLVAWGAFFVLFVIFVGLRHKVGMDWNNYLLMIDRASSGSMAEALTVSEPGYALWLRAAGSLGWGMYAVNFLTALVFGYGLFKLSRKTPIPWLAMMVAMPNLVMVVAMSANRQTVAIGILMWLIADWEKSSLTKRVVLTLLASQFHYSASFFLMFAALELDIRPRYKLLLSVSSVVLMVVFLNISGGADIYERSYINTSSDITQSSGALEHVLLNGGPALLMLLGRRIRSQLFPSALLINMGILAIALMPVSLVYSAAAGRMSLYLFPVSMYALSGVPGIFRHRAARALARTTIVIFMMGILWFWLQFANSSYAHIPYKNMLFMDTEDLRLCCEQYDTH